MRRLAIAFALATLVSTVWAASAGAQATPLFPGATYDQTVEFTPHGPVSIHVVRGPRPVGLYRLRPVLSNDSIVLRAGRGGPDRRDESCEGKGDGEAAHGPPRVAEPK